MRSRWRESVSCSQFPPGGETGSCLSYKQMLGVQFPPGRPLPRCIIRSAPVSDTGGPGAKPGEAATFISTKDKHREKRGTGGWGGGDIGDVGNGISQYPNTTSPQCPRSSFMSDILNKTIVLVLNRNWQ